MRVVLDTNVVLSACMKPGGLEARTVALAISGDLTACVSAAIEAEYRDVLFREKFAPFHARAEELLRQLAGRWSVFEPTSVVTAASDEDDNRFLECAQEAEAAFLVTGNLRDYPQHWLGTQVLNARDFLQMLDEASPVRSGCGVLPADAESS